MNRWKIGLYLTAIFVAGTVTGGLIVLKIGRQMIGHPPKPEQMAAHWANDLETKLKLDAEQKQKIESILNQSMHEFQVYMSHRMLVGLKEVNARIAAELTSEQRGKFESIEKEQFEFVRRLAGDEPEPASTTVLYGTNSNPELNRTNE